jgi:hypothetical protein
MVAPEPWGPLSLWVPRALGPLSLWGPQALGVPRLSLVSLVQLRLHSLNETKPKKTKDSNYWFSLVNAP